MTAEELRNKLIKLATEEVGYVGDNGTSASVPNKTNKYSNWLDDITGFYNGKKNGYNWCAIFVDYIGMKAMGGDLDAFYDATYHNSCGAGVRYCRNAYVNVGRCDATPQPGDEVFYFNKSSGLYSHTGIVVAVDNNGFTTVEGNCSNSVKMYVKKFNANDGYEHSFGHPNYEAAAKILTAKEPAKESEAYKDREFTEDEKWAIECGLFIGYPDGTFHFDEPITRGQMCTVLKRFSEAVYGM